MLNINVMLTRIKNMSVMKVKHKSQQIIQSYKTCANSNKFIK